MICCLWLVKQYKNVRNFRNFFTPKLEKFLHFYRFAQLGQNWKSLIVRKRQVRFQKFFVCDLLTPHGFSGRNFVRGVIYTLNMYVCTYQNHSNVRYLMVPVLAKISHFFLLLVKKNCFHLVSCENVQSLITFNQVSKSFDRLQIQVNLANPKIKNQ